MKIPKTEQARIREERSKVFDAMCNENLNSDEWNELQKKYRDYTEMLKPSWSVSPDTLAVVAGNLIGIVLILNHEKLDIVTSKALGFVLRGRV